MSDIRRIPAQSIEATLRRRVTQLETALARYGRHAATCDTKKPGGGLCTCGYTAAQRASHAG